MNIALITIPTRVPWHPNDPETWGGSEAEPVLLTRALKAAGHEVTVYWSHGETVDDAGGISYRPYPTTELTVDCAIYHNCQQPFPTIVAGRRILWTYQAIGFDARWFDWVVTHTDFTRRQLLALVPAAAARIRIIPDGHEPLEPQTVARDPRLVLHTASPDRGLEQTVQIWGTVHAAQPAARLRITYGWDKYLAYGGDRAVCDRVAAIVAADPSITMQRATAVEMRALYAEAGIWAYYCTGNEAFSHAAIQAQLAGAIPVVRPQQALHETVWSGLTVPTLEGYTHALIEALGYERQTALRAAQEALLAAGQPTVKRWSEVADLWAPLLVDPAPALSSKLMDIPETPRGLVADVARLAQDALIRLIQEWAQAFQVKAPYIDPTLGIPSPPAPHDGLVVGWALEDHPDGWRAAMAQWPMPNHSPVLILTSQGPWRGALRRRALGRRDLVEMFGAQPDAALRSAPVGDQGNGVLGLSFRVQDGAFGERDLPRVRRSLSPADTVSICLMVRNSEESLLGALRSVVPIADEVVIANTGCTDRTLEIIDQFATESKIPTRVVEGTPPRYCWDCLVEHPVGEMFHGHRFAGFETARNQSIAPAQGDWILWIDADETMLHPERLRKYLRGTPFKGFSIPQDHHACDPPQAYKRDLPVRVFRREVDPTDVVGFQPFGEHRWPTYHTGFTARFSGVVHEHPGHGPHYYDGLGPVMVLSDIWLAHSGYFTEAQRRGRFCRNWPLMVADRMKYHGRRLGLFLWLRDLVHQFRYMREMAGGQIPGNAVPLAEEGIDIYNTHFLGAIDMMSTDALGYVSAFREALGRGVQIDMTSQGMKQELMPQPLGQIAYSGRFESLDEAVAHYRARLSEWGQWFGPYV